MDFEILSVKSILKVSSLLISPEKKKESVKVKIFCFFFFCSIVSNVTSFS